MLCGTSLESRERELVTWLGHSSLARIGMEAGRTDGPDGPIGALVIPLNTSLADSPRPPHRDPLRPDGHGYVLPHANDVFASPMHSSEQPAAVKREL